MTKGARVHTDHREQEREQPEPLVFSVREAALALGIGKDLCYELIYRGELPHLRLSTRIVVPRKALSDFVEAGCTCTGPRR